MIRGTYIHEMMEAIYGWYLMHNGGLVDRPIPEEILNCILIPAPGEADLMLKMEAGQLVRLYHDHYMLHHDKHWRVLAVEEHIEFPYVLPSGRQALIETYIDLVVMNVMTGEQLIVDHKSGAPWKQEELPWDQQQMLYLAGLNYAGYETDKVVINNLMGKFTKNSGPLTVNKAFNRLTYKMSRVRMTESLRQLGLHIDSILDDEEYAMTFTKNCASCRFNEICVANLEQRHDQERMALKLMPGKPDSRLLRKQERITFLETVNQRKQYFYSNNVEPELQLDLDFE